MIRPGSLAAALYRRNRDRERHRHRYEVNNNYRAALEKAGFKATGTSPDDALVEIMELRGHPWFLGCQFHPELRSRPLDCHPLFRGLIRAAVERRAATAPERSKVRELRTVRDAWRKVQAGGVIFGGPRLVADRRSLRDRERGVLVAPRGAARRDRAPAGVAMVFKSSFDKANRTSHYRFAAPAWRRDCASWRAVKRETGNARADRYSRAAQAAAAASVVDMLQIPALLSRQTDW